MKYVYQVRFQGNKGKSLWPYDSLMRSRAKALDKAKTLDSVGLRYGAFVKRIRVTQDVWERAF